ncbi:putative protein N(5)-glutamine methyltransferase [Spongisporangium articulatum]|uniref:peptide chain release factor N(5)-glutamine methyltransferase n=1 Tax=Spongisporangium articulatum TaxID=3362603 RepID=A0ABW8AMV4_9ACTN
MAPVPDLDFDDTVTRLRAAGCAFAEEEAGLLLEAATDPAGLADLVRRRVDGEPLEVILGWVAFCGLRLAIDPHVFVPRQRTALLAERAARLAADMVRPGDAVVDLCCGCGAVGAVIAARVPGVELHLADVDPRATALARRNVGAAAVHTGDLLEALPVELRGRVAVLAANAPYVPSDAVADMPPEARDHEPRAALDGGPDGLGVIRRILAEARQWLRPGGVFAVECSTGQVPLLLGAVRAAGLTPTVETDDERGATVVLARRSG